MNMVGGKGWGQTTITMGIQSQSSFCDGTPITFAAYSSCYVNPSYQWYVNGNPINGETKSTFTTTILKNNDSVYCIQTNNTAPCTVVTSSSVPIKNILPKSTISLSSAPGTNLQTVCQNTNIVNISYSLTGASGINYVTGLPYGISNNGTLTISGSSKDTGIFNYMVSTYGGCGSDTAYGTIKINNTSTSKITLKSSAGTDSQIVCQNILIDTVKFNVTGASGINVNGLPNGINNNGTLNITGSSKDTGIYNYTVTTTGGKCGSDTYNGKIKIISSPHISLSSKQGTDNQTICQYDSINNIIYKIDGGDSAMVFWTPSNPGLKYKVSNNNFIISGIPNKYGTFKYKIIPTGGNCISTDTSTGTIFINPKPTANFTFSPNNNCGNSPVSFTNNNVVNNCTYNWNFGDNSNYGYSQNVSHTYISGNSIGNGSTTYPVVLIVKSYNSNCADTTSQIITIKQIPEAILVDPVNDPQFTHCSSTADSFPLTISNLSTTNNTYYNINWGDKTTDFDSTNLSSGTSHTYFSQGYFNLTLTVTGQNGCQTVKSYSVYNGSNPQVPFINSGASVQQCVPFTINVPSTIDTNSAGTIYIFQKNDGTSDDTLTHNNLPKFYTHTFLNSSCGAVGSSDPNSYFIKIIANNQCYHSYTTIGPITTGNKVKAEIEVQPDDSTYCVGTRVDFINRSLTGVMVDGNGVCDSANPRNWIVTPKTGWVNTGSLGVNNPVKNLPSQWGANTLGLTFSIPGVYNILFNIKSTCGNDTAIKSICVNPIPVALFTLNKHIICAGDSIIATNKSSQPICSNNTYKWIVSQTKLAGCRVPVLPVYNNLDSNPVFKFSAPGTYIIGLTDVIA